MVAVLPALRAAIHSPRQVGVGAPYGAVGCHPCKRAAIKLGARFLFNSRCNAAKNHAVTPSARGGGKGLEPWAPETQTPRKI